MPAWADVFARGDERLQFDELGHAFFKDAIIFEAAFLQRLGGTVEGGTDKLLVV